MPTITKISPQKNNKERYNIYLDGKYAFPVSLNVVAKFNLKKDQEITEQYKWEILNEESYEKYLNKVLDFIDYKIRTQREIEGRLYKYLYRDIKDKEGIRDLHAKIMEKIANMDLINDKNYAISYIEGKKMSSTPPGRYKIKTFLLKKGVDSKLIEECLQEFSEETELEGAKKEAEKKMRKLNPQKIKDKQKLWNHLQRKGYSSHIIRGLVDSYFKV